MTRPAFKNRYNLHKYLKGAPGFNARKRTFTVVNFDNYTQKQIETKDKLVSEYGYAIQLTFE